MNVFKSGSQTGVFFIVTDEMNVIFNSTGKNPIRAPRIGQPQVHEAQINFTAQSMVSFLKLTYVLHTAYILFV